MSANDATHDADVWLATAFPLWLEAHCAYQAAYEMDADESVTGRTNAVVNRIESEIRDAGAASMSGVTTKLKIVELCLNAEDDPGAEDRAAAMSLSLARDMLRLARECQDAAQTR